MKENMIVMFAIMLTAMSAQAQEVKKNSVGEAEKVEVVVKETIVKMKKEELLQWHSLANSSLTLKWPTPTERFTN